MVSRPQNLLSPWLAVAPVVLSAMVALAQSPAVPQKTPVIENSPSTDKSAAETRDAELVPGKEQAPRTKAAETSGEVPDVETEQQAGEKSTPSEAIALPADTPKPPPTDAAMCVGAARATPRRGQCSGTWRAHAAWHRVGVAWTRE